MESEQLLTPSAAGKQLGVHPNTIRNWAKSGELPSVKLEGSGHLRFRPEDVEAHRARRSRRDASVAAAHSVLAPELVDATFLDQWATRYGARFRGPEVVRRLHAVTPGITEVDMPAGEAVSTPGWDGQARSAGSVFLPKGELRFEIGAGENPKGKAQDDFNKRRGELGTKAESLTFVFVTPRRWPSGDKWAEERRAEGVFADVHVLDAEKLAAWLATAPAVHYWLSELLGQQPQDVETLERWWRRFSGRTQPQLPPDLFLAGRDAAVDDLREALKSTPDEAVTVKGSTADDALAFISAALERLADQEALTVAYPPLVVSSAQVWNRLVREPEPLTLIPSFGDPDFGLAREGGHTVLVGLGRESKVNATLSLRRPERTAASASLEQAGLPDDRAYQLAGLARRSLSAFVRQLARDPNLKLPAWADPNSSESHILAALVLIGSWTENDPADIEVVSEITGVEPVEVEKVLLRWHVSNDPPFIRSSGRWHAVSREEALQLLHDQISGGALERWCEAVVGVLLEPDPVLDLPRDERILADVRGVRRKWSPTLRQGLASGLALLGASEGVALNAVDAPKVALGVVRELLRKAAKDETGKTWALLSQYLPLLAEAAPEDFLNAIHEDLDQADPTLLKLFESSGHALFGPSSHHPALLWALETLAWSDRYLVSSTSAIARLTAANPLSEGGNRPETSLHSILVGWIRQTSGDVDDRIAAIDRILEDEPDVGWNLLLALWPKIQSSVSPPSQPKYRDWRPPTKSVSLADWARLVAHLVTQAIEVASATPARWSELLEHLGPLPEVERDRLISSFERAAADGLPDEVATEVWSSLREVAATHREFDDADWAMPEEALERLETIASELAPPAAAYRFKYLFDDWFPSGEGLNRDNHDAYERALAKRRSEAVQEIWAADGIDGIELLASVAVQPQLLGSVISQEDLEGLQVPTMIGWLENDDKGIREAAVGWTSHQLRTGGSDRLAELLALTPGQAEQLTLLRVIPEDPEFWDLLAADHPDLAETYWETVRLRVVEGAALERACEELLARGRGWEAIQQLSMSVRPHRDDADAPSRDTIVKALDAALSDEEGLIQIQQPAYAVAELLDHLAREGAEEQVVRFEYAYLALLDHVRSPSLLYEAMGEEPDDFVEAVRLAFRGKSETQRKLGGEDLTKAEHAHILLHSWHELPGTAEDGTVDFEHLTTWVRGARLKLSDLDRTDIGDEQLGQLLAHSPTSPEGLWPTPEIAELIEAIGSARLETGIHVGRINARGMTFRSLSAGGAQELEIAGRYEDWAAEHSRQGARRTARLLHGLAEDYKDEARREDAEAEARDDLD